MKLHQLTLGALLCGALSCSGPPADHPNVLLIVVDTLRADRLGCYGNPRGLTPFVDDWAQGGRRFAEAQAHAPWTLPSMASLLTSRYPQEHGAGGSVPRVGADGNPVGGFRRLSDDCPTLAERFARAGYTTFSVVNVDFLGEQFGLTRGFEHVDARFFANNREVRPAAATTGAALARIDLGLDTDRDRPFFGLVHYFDAHAVYAPLPSFRRRFADPRDRADESFVFGTRQQMVDLRVGRLPLEPDTIQRAERLYDAEVAYVDGEIGRLLDGLARRGLTENTIVVLTSDHGEEFLEHGGFEHGHTLYRELLHVPLVLSWPGHIAPGVEPEPVGLVDVAPTLCELAGVRGDASFRGRSLAPALRGKGDLGPPRQHLAHGNFWGPPLSSLAIGPLGLIRGGPGDLELYDQRSDSGQRVDLTGARPELTSRLLSDLESLEASMAAGAGAGVELSQEALERLRGLGYGGGEGEAD